MSMAVNALVTGLIVFKILRVFLRVNPILVEHTLDHDSSGGGKTSARYIHNNRIWHGVVHHSTASPRVYQPASGFSDSD